MSKESIKLSLKEKLGYATGDFASNLFWQPFTIFLLYYYTDIFGISAAAIGTMFLITRIWDTFFDPIVGIVSDRTQTRWGKFRPYLLWFAIPFGLVGALTYLAPDLSQGGKLVFAYITYTIMMMIYSAINVPYSALLGVISPDPHERESASSYKFAFAFLAGIIVQAATLPMVNFLGKNDQEIVKLEVKNDTLYINEVKNGTAKITLSANDGKGGTKEQTFYVKVYKPGLIPPKAKITPATDTLFENFGTKIYDLTGLFENNSTDKLKFEAKCDNEKVVRVRVVNNQLLIKEAGKGISSITIDASNDVGTASISFTVIVTTRDNHFPVKVSKIDTLNLMKGFKKKEIDVSPIFSDPDADNLYYFATTSDAKVVGTTIKKNKLTINEVGIGKSQIILYAYDSKGGFATDTISLRVDAPGNAIPIIEKPIDNQNLVAGFGQLAIPVHQVFSDKDNDKLNLNVTLVNESKGYFHTMGIFAILAVLMFFITFLTTHERVRPISENNSSIKDDLKDLLKNKPWLVLFALSIFMQIYVAIRQSSIIYYFKYYVGNTELAALYLVLGTIASLIGAFLIQYPAKKFGKKLSYIMLIIFGTLFTVLTFWVKPDQYVPMFALQFILQFFTGPLSPLLWAMYTDSADYSEWKTGRRATGLILSASVFSLKFGWAIGSAITGWLLAYFGFQANIIQNIEAQTGIRMLISIIPSISLVLAGFAMFFYQLNQKTLAQMTAELAERRKKESN